MTSSSLYPEIYIGSLRIQILSDCLLRLERADSTGFEDQATFHVVNRFFAMPKLEVDYRRFFVRCKTRKISFDIPIFIKELTEITFRTETAKFAIENVLEPQDFPEPGDLPDYWLFADFPRLIPPEMGATAPPKELAEDFLSGWQISDNQEDFYVFFPKTSGYDQFRRELLNLTGQIPLIPKHVLGFIYSRYFAFRDSEILEQVRQYKIRRMPIDMFVVDTDWRVGGSSGYEVNKELFPDVETFFNLMHQKNISVMFNDHPEPFDHVALSPPELKSREESLGCLLEKGLDSWWYDRNWHTALDEPAPGLGKDIWGMRLYHDITEKLKPQKRPLIMANVPGIRNGIKERASNVATHRYPIWWTGDTKPEWASLKNAIGNAVNEGIKAFLPYVSDDIGGHFGKPSDELYMRYVQFGCLSPIFRLHCTSGSCRDPWEYGEEAERTMANYLSLRLKLLPMLYTAAFEAYETGIPILRRCDLYWPEYAEARNPYQYLLGNDLLIAPVFKEARPGRLSSEKLSVREIWIPPGIWHNVWDGKLIEGPQRRFMKCRPWETPIFARDGAIIFSQTQIENTGSQNWQKIVADIFVPEQRFEVKQFLYEDDGETSAYLEGLSSKTVATLKRFSDQLELRINPPEGDFIHGFDKRSWYLRFHFSKFTRLASIFFNGNFLLPDQYNYVKKVERPASLPFICRPGYLGKDSGETIEVNFENFPLGKELILKLKLV
ncbi:MAG: alpha-glucosidase [Candidatus Rifleibacteriota bacterium]